MSVLDSIIASLARAIDRDQAEELQALNRRLDRIDTAIAGVGTRRRPPLPRRTWRGLALFTILAGVLLFISIHLNETSGLLITSDTTLQAEWQTQSLDDDILATEIQTQEIEAAASGDTQVVSQLAKEATQMLNTKTVTPPSTAAMDNASNTQAESVVFISLASLALGGISGLFVFELVETTREAAARRNLTSSSSAPAEVLPAAPPQAP